MTHLRPRRHSRQLRPGGRCGEARVARVGLSLAFSRQVSLYSWVQARGGGQRSPLITLHTHTYTDAIEAHSPARMPPHKSRHYLVHSIAWHHRTPRMPRHTTSAAMLHYPTSGPLACPSRGISASRHAVPHHPLRCCACSLVHASSDRAGSAHCLMHMLRFRPCGLGCARVHASHHGCALVGAVLALSSRFCSSCRNVSA